MLDHVLRDRIAGDRKNGTGKNHDTFGCTYDATGDIHSGPHTSVTRFADNTAGGASAVIIYQSGIKTIVCNSVVTDPSGNTSGIF